MSELQAFQPALILETLLRHEVRFVLVGGLAAQAHGSPSLTGDVNVCHATDATNLAHLAAALGGTRRGASLLAARHRRPAPRSTRAARWLRLTATR